MVRYGIIFFFPNLTASGWLSFCVYSARCIYRSMARKMVDNALLRLRHQVSSSGFRSGRA
ncbi:hypothetical protein P280DRAFT_468095 [Massarina eburnea CBS 473.64]|uniref:Uncharacterized protein n=1 Tax=Massarina eburnea CBS 473.64 TaxID=1395130 RepID=A0A6A6S4E5_9PLEO|nr:hypothetical protein P280DRAFT_468095 [Massarina eburnea CBS 473.64]